MELIKAVEELSQGLFETKLSKNLYKKRISVPGRGKRGGARTILTYQHGMKTFFLYGFLKNEKENISEKEHFALEELAKLYIELTENQLSQALKIGELIEVAYAK